MKYLQRSTLLLIILVSSVIVCFAQSGNPPPPPAPAIEYNASAWKETSSAVGDFTVLMPGTPTLTTEQVETDAGKISNRLLHLSTKTAVYMVSFADFPVRLDEPDVVKQALDASRDNILAEDKSTNLLSEKEIDFNGQAGREWLIQKGKDMIRVRAFFIKERFYQIGISTPLNVAFKTRQPSANPQDRTDFYEATSTKFLDSFKLTVNEKALGEVDSYLAKEQVMGKAAENSTGVIIRGGILNGKALSFPPPVYPPIARAARATGRVIVKIIVDEEGKVVAAQVESGHPLLQQAALKVAREAQFAPTLLDGKPVKVFGALTYNFVAK